MKKDHKEKCVINSNFPKDNFIKNGNENNKYIFLINKFKELYQNTTNNDFYIISGINKNLIEFFPKTINYLITMELEEQTFLGFYNIAKRVFHPDEFNLHKAIYENNLKKINDICKNER